MDASSKYGLVGQVPRFVCRAPITMNLCGGENGMAGVDKVGGGKAG
jgi:hypothetical protein